MKIINGPKWLNLASSTRSIKLAPLTVSDNMIADRQLLATLMTTYKPGEFLIFMDSSLELNTFTSLDLGTKTGLKDQFLCTDIESGIAKMITPYEEAAVKEAEEAKKAQEEQLKMASYKQKYEDAKSQLEATFEENNNLRKAYTEEKSKVDEITTKLSESESTIAELRTALQSAADKIESMKNEFNAACKEFGLNKDADGKWVQDLSKVIEYTELKKDYEGLNTEFKRHKESWNLLHDDLMEVQKQFGIYKDDEGKWCMIKDEKYQGDSNTTSKVPTEDANELSAERCDELDNKENEVIEGSNVSESKEY